MTREKAIEILKNSAMKDTLSEQWKKAYKMAISALEQMPEVTSTMQTGQFDYAIECPYPNDCPHPYGIFKNCLECKEKSVKQQPCEDAVNRDAVMGLVAREHTEWDDLYIDIAKLPSVTQKSGKWIRKYDSIVNELYWECNKCGEGFQLTSNYCPNCGADMRGAE